MYKRQVLGLFVIVVNQKALPHEWWFISSFNATAPGGSLVCVSYLKRRWGGAKNRFDIIFLKFYDFDRYSKISSSLRSKILQSSSIVWAETYIFSLVIPSNHNFYLLSLFKNMKRYFWILFRKRTISLKLQQDYVSSPILHSTPECLLTPPIFL